MNREGAGVLEEIDRAGILATPQNSAYNERVIEAARESIAAEGKLVKLRQFTEKRSSPD